MLLTALLDDELAQELRGMSRDARGVLGGRIVDHLDVCGDQAGDDPTRDVVKVRGQDRLLLLTVQR